MKYREKIRGLVIKAITDTNKLTEVVDELCFLFDVSKCCNCGSKLDIGEHEMCEPCERLN